jgi:menaquinol-cytochrome c reductase iron-sulfur subunit
MSKLENPDPPSRRSFVKEAAAIVIGGIITLVPVAAGLFAWLDPVRRKQGGAAGFVKVATLDALPADGIPRKFTVHADFVDAWTRVSQAPVGAVYLRRPAEKQVVALHTVCPHAGCFVDYREGQKDFFCPCHNSAFGTDGSISSPKSPSPRPMDALEVEVRGNEIWVRFQNFAAGHKDKRPIA